MPAPTANFPNLRKMFMADEGHTFFDIDLERADAQVVAWDAGDEQLKQMFREKVDLHTENAKTLFRTNSPSSDQRKKAKATAHAMNYGVTAKTLASNIKITIKEAESIIDRWFEAHPAIKQWHDDIWNQLKKERRIYNAFGFQITFYGRIDNAAWREALSWKPQSLVGLVTNMGLVNIAENLTPKYGVKLLLQVHDSLPHEIPNSVLPELRPSEDGKKLTPHGDATVLHEVRRNMEIEIPYDDPLVIPVSLEAGPNWGDLKEVEL